MEIMQNNGKGMSCEPVVIDPAILEYEKMKVKRLNAVEGNLTGYDCKECKNRGFIHVIGINGLESAVACKCKKIRDTIKLAKQSGAYMLMTDYKLDNYETTKDWQVKAKSLVEKYIADNSKAWLYFGGITGSGKTHLCTAAFASMIKHGMSGLYIMWREEARKLIKSGYDHFGDTDKRIHAIKTAEILYIDDLFKSDDDSNPSSDEIGLAYEIINFRYSNKLKTILSGELTLTSLADINKAISGRIKERCGEYTAILEGEEKNYRLKAGK